MRPLHSITDFEAEKRVLPSSIITGMLALATVYVAWLTIPTFHYGMGALLRPVAPRILSGPQACHGYLLDRRRPASLPSLKGCKAWASRLWVWRFERIKRSVSGTPGVRTCLGERNCWEPFMLLRKRDRFTSTPGPGYVLGWNTSVKPGMIDDCGLVGRTYCPVHLLCNLIIFATTAQ